MKVEVQKKRISDKPVWTGRTFDQLLDKEDGLASSVGFKQDGGGWARQVARPKTSPSQTLQYVPKPMLTANLAAQPAPVQKQRAAARKPVQAFGLRRTRTASGYPNLKVRQL
jgi:hypothetical protein